MHYHYKQGFFFLVLTSGSQKRRPKNPEFDRKVSKVRQKIVSFKNPTQHLLREIFYKFNCDTILAYKKKYQLYVRP